ncbi:MAG: enoyl-CoA hydratase/isomerase family protein, partial [Chloroflexota bacterium]
PARHDADLRLREGKIGVGGDIKAWGALEPLRMGWDWVRDGSRVFDRLAALRVPTIAAINGYCFGGGLELALACDLRVAAADTDLAFPEAKVGIVPGWAGTRRLPDLIGPARAKQLIFTGARIPAPRAEAWGLVNETAPAPGVLARARELAAEIAANSPVAVAVAKVAIDGREDALEVLAGALARYTDDGREGVASFTEKRPPTFTGS